MKKLILFTQTEKNKLVSKRSGESKFGDQIQLLTDSSNIYDQLTNLDVSHVLFGIPEDIGVFANQGNTGASGAWKPAIKFLLNTQSNSFTNPGKLAVLGYLDFTAEQASLAALNPKKISDLKKARKLVEQIDKHVTQLVHDIVKAGKRPIIIGGGHNNAYGAIKGTSLALNKKINAINLDTQLNFRPEEGRHSGNGFSYAFAEGFLGKYFAFGVQEQLLPQKSINTTKKLSKYVAYNTYEALYVRKGLKFKKECLRALEFVSGTPFGIEIDCSAIERFPADHMTLSAFSPDKVREFMNFFATHEHAAYLHISEFAPELGSRKKIKPAAGFIASLIIDFLRL